MSTISQFDNDKAEQHLSEAEVLTFLRQGLTPAQNTRLQQHLLDCWQCQELYQDANDFCQPRRAAEAFVSEAQIQESWSQLKQFVQQAEPQVMAATAPRPLARAAAATSRRWVLPLAAVFFLLLTATAVTFWRSRQTATFFGTATVKTPDALSNSPINQPTPPLSQQESANSQATNPKLRTTTKPSAKVDDKTAPAIYEVAQLMLSSGEKSAAEVSAAKVIQVPASAQQLRFRLVRYEPREFPAYQVELLDAAGTVRQAVTGKLAKGNLIEAIFQQAELTDGEYQLRVTGKGGQRQDLTPQTTLAVNLSFKTP
ncbi:MAG: hypothetical protein HYR56_23615 [Acidobacteria bacterium]|nr:hypothetical protein [Acidobacteriota bacterium]MBI3422999.1 hypothetical protein [Acidobacteriota bacterium]